MLKNIPKNLVKFVNILGDGKYHAGNAIGDQLQMSRSAVWKIVKKLQNYKVKIDSIKGKGYALLEPLVLLDFDKIKKCLPQNVDLYVFETVDSTNNYLKTFKNSKYPKVCIAEQQTQGKGRFNRSWYSPFGKNIYLSCLYPFQKDVSELGGLSLLTSLAVKKTLNEHGIHDPLGVKWSNDIVYDYKKISGNLIEVQAETHDASQAIIGIGINVNMLQDEAHQISQEWISMAKILNQDMDRNLLCNQLLYNLFAYLQKFATNGFSPFLEEWLLADCLLNKSITLKNAQEKNVGRCLGINGQGHLVLELANGTIRSFSAGETTLIKNG